MTPTTSIVSALCALLAAGGGMWFRSDSRQKPAVEEFHKIQDEVRMTEPETMTPPLSGSTEPEEAPHGGAASFLAADETVVLFGIASVILLAAGFARFLFFRPVPVKVAGKGALTIKVVKAHNLHNLDAEATKKGGKDVTDAYVEVNVHGKRKMTKTVEDSYNPIWDEAVGPFELDFDAKQQFPEPAVIVNVWDYEGLCHSGSFLGGLKLNTQELVANVLKKNAGKGGKGPLVSYAHEYQLQDAPELAVHDAQKHEPAKLTIEVAWAPHTPAVSKPGGVKRGRAPKGK